MPLFILISGYLFSEKRTVKEFIAGKFDGLIKPVITILFFSAILISGWWFLKGESIYAALKHTIFILASNYVTLWFPVVLFLSLVLLRIFIRLHRVGKYYALPVIVGVVFLLSIVSQSGFNLYSLKFHVILYFLIFLSIGYLIKKRNLLDNLLKTGSF